jgi:hypothetical protein
LPWSVYQFAELQFEPDLHLISLDVQLHEVNRVRQMPQSLEWSGKGPKTQFEIQAQE